MLSEKQIVSMQNLNYYFFISQLLVLFLIATLGAVTKMIVVMENGNKLQFKKALVYACLPTFLTFAAQELIVKHIGFLSLLPVTFVMGILGETITTGVASCKDIGEFLEKLATIHRIIGGMISSVQTNLDKENSETENKSEDDNTG